MSHRAGRDPQEASAPIVDEARQQLRAPWAASVAGLLFAGFFTAALVLVRTQALVDAVASWDWIVLVLPAWVAVISLFILRRERSHVSARVP